MAETKIVKCAHPGCNCPVAKGTKYCSPYCESSGSRMSIACNCGIRSVRRRKRRVRRGSLSSIRSGNMIGGGGKSMRRVVLAALLTLAFARGALSQSQADIVPTGETVVAQDFTVDDVPISIKVPFEVLVNGKVWQGRGFGWHIGTGSTIWLGVPTHGMYVLSLAPRESYNFEKAGNIRDNVIAFRDGSNEYEIRTSGPIFGSGKSWNLYVLHLPENEMKGPLFGVDRLGTCTLAHLR
jgi:hypothetical protein